MDNYRLKVTLSDGRRGIFDVSPYLNMGDLRELQDPQYFRQVKIANDTINWHHEQDIAPDTVEYLLQLEPASV